MARKKKAWNMSNPLYRYLHKKKAKSRKVRAVKVRAKRKRGVFMARRRTSRRGKGGMGGAGSMAKVALIGIGAAEFAKFIPVSVPFKEEAVGAVAGYLIGGKSVKNAAVGGGAVFVKKMLTGEGSMSAGGSGITVY